MPSHISPALNNGPKSTVYGIDRAPIRLKPVLSLNFEFTRLPLYDHKSLSSKSNILMTGYIINFVEFAIIVFFCILQYGLLLCSGIWIKRALNLNEGKKKVCNSRLFTKSKHVS